MRSMSSFARRGRALEHGRPRLRPFGDRLLETGLEAMEEYILSSACRFVQIVRYARQIMDLIADLGRECTKGAHLSSLQSFPDS